MRALALWLCLLAACSPAQGAQRGESSVALAQTTPGARALQDAFIGVARSVSASVVAIRFERGMGSGVVIRADGYILTNRHVVRGANRLEVVLQDGRKLAGKVVGVDPATDLAVLKVTTSGLRAAKLADSNQVRPGQWVIAIGSPFGLDYTVTVGVVSAVGRGDVGMNEIEDYLQTDASINPGNSGGPLVSLEGEVVGINTMIVGGGTGIGFAIPSSLARNVADQLIDKGSVHRAYIGVAFQELTPELAEQFGGQGRGGALVSSVEPKGPADTAGLRPGDVITSLDGQPIGESRDLLRAVLAKQVGAKVQLGVLRDKQELSVVLVTVERPGDAHARVRAAPSPAANVQAGLGLGVTPLTAELSRAIGYLGTEGVAVVDVQPGSPAERAGLTRGDVILEADRKPVKVPPDLDVAMADGSALLRVVRRGAFRYVVLDQNE